MVYSLIAAVKIIAARYGRLYKLEYEYLLVFRLIIIAVAQSCLIYAFEYHRRKDRYIGQTDAEYAHADTFGA